MERINRVSEHLLELLVFLMVLFASLSIVTESELNAEEEELELDNISGTIILSTRSAMNALGLNENTEIGAVATVNLTVNSIESEGCVFCNQTPIGFEIRGDVEIKNIRNQNGGLGRVEGELGITYLKEYVNQNFIIREWLKIDWNASGGKELDTFTQITINHDPPIWDVSNRYDASFLITEENGKQSRTGPWLLANTLINKSMKIQGCLPNSLNCEKGLTPDIDLITIEKLVENPKKISHDFKIEKIILESSTNNTPTKIEGIRNIFQLKNESSIHNVWCNENNEDFIAIKSWNVESKNNNIIAPMNLWFKILGLPSSIFFQTNGYWTEIEYNEYGCASLSDNNGKLKLNIIIN